MAGIDPSSLSTSQFIRYLLTGSPTGGAANGGYGPNAFGSSGLDFANTLAQIQSGGTNGQIDPRLYQYFQTEQQGGENPTTQFVPTGNVSNQGTIMIDGKPWIQLAGATDNTTIKNRDPSMFKSDPTFGELTPADNVVSGSDPFSDIAPWAMLAIASAGAGGLLDGITGAGTMGPNANYAGMLAQNGATDVPIGEAGYTGLEGAGGATAAAPGSAALDVAAPGMGGSATVDDFLIQHGMSGLAGGPLSNLLGGNFAAAGSGLLAGAMNNPLQAVGLLQMARGVTGSHGQSSSSSSGKSAGNGAGLPAPQGRSAWTPNSFTQRQIQQLYGPGVQ